MPPYSAVEIANYFLQTSGFNISPMKVQKLVYYAHAWHLALHGTPLIQEQVEAWRYGPVIPNLYTELRAYGNNLVTRLIDELSYEDLEFHPVAIPEDDHTLDHLNSIWDSYGDFSATRLSNMTHIAGSPWAQTWHENIAPNTAIPNETIEHYFVNLRNQQID